MATHRCLTQLVILIGDLDLLLPIVTGCFLICFCAVNLTCFALEFFPTRKVEVHFKLYSKWSALLGFVLSLGATFLNSVSGIVAAMLTVLVSLVVWSKRSELSAVLSKQENVSHRDTRVYRDTSGNGGGGGGGGGVRSGGVRSGGVRSGVRSGEKQDEMIAEIHDKERSARRRETGYEDEYEDETFEEDGDYENKERRRRRRRRMTGPSTYIDLLENDERREERREEESDDDPTAALVKPLLSSSGEEDMFTGAGAGGAGGGAGAGAAATSRSLRRHRREGKKQERDREEEMLWDQDEHLVRLASSYVRDALKGRYNRLSPWGVDVVVSLLLFFFFKKIMNCF